MAEAGGDEQPEATKLNRSARPVEVAPALAEVQPSTSILVVAIGSALRVCNTSTGEAVALKDETQPPRHREAIRAIAFDKSGSLFASAGDDKLLKLWDTATWTCFRTVAAPKKVSSVVFSRDGAWVCFADKYGVVHVAPTAADTSATAPAQLLAHCCSIITSLAMSPDGRFLASADRDHKVRVSVFPEEPLGGAPEIQSFCLGHTLYVTCVAFLGAANQEGCLLVSGGGDGTVRLWEADSGELLDTLSLATSPNGETESGGDTVMEEETDAAEGGADTSGGTVLALAVQPGTHTLAVLLEGCGEVLLVRCKSEQRRLELAQRVPLPNRAPPTGVAFGGGNRLWLVAGAVDVPEHNDGAITPEVLDLMETRAAAAAAAAAVRVTLLKRTDAKETAYGPVTDFANEAAMRTVLEGSQADADAAMVAARKAAEALKSQLGKRAYPDVDRELKKRGRNDRKLKLQEKS